MMWFDRLILLLSLIVLELLVLASGHEGWVGSKLDTEEYNKEMEGNY